MPYDSTITFTLDTICPWTYLGFLRLRKALASYRATHPSSPVSFTLRIAPYQLYPDFSPVGENKYEWYMHEKYNNSPERMDKYVAYMTALGRDEGVEMKFDEKKGEIANTLNAHRVLWWIQENKREEDVLNALSSLYTQYFCESAHPSAPATLTAACQAAGLSESETKDLVGDESEGLSEVKMAIREQVGNAVDSVPYVVFEGRRRDFTLVGAKSVAEYEKVLGQVEKEAL
ncbi:thioredoxin-like protein [Paraphoma chrysanthemicola]|nr:thioredoxin-like protein [Paraphoma chrysanthemicola]